MPFLLLAAGAGILSSVIGGVSSNAAANTQASAEEQAAQIQQQMFEQVQGNEQPFLAGGQNALAALQTGLGIGPGGTGQGALNTPFNPQNLQNTPGYQFTQQQGLEGLEDASTATGGVGGGNALKGIVGYSEGLASTTYQQQLQDYMAQQQQSYGQLYDLSQLGANAGSNSATNASGFGANIGSAVAGAGAANAAGILGVGNAAAGGINNLANNYLTGSYLSGGGSNSIYDNNPVGSAGLDALATGSSGDGANPFSWPG